MDVASVDGLSYNAPGAARPGAAVPPGLRLREQRVPLGEGARIWRRAVEVVSGWAIKQAIGFTVAPDDPVVVEGRDYETRYGWMRVHEPVRVIWVADEPNRRGFGYGTRPGHPITGEECFLVERDPDGSVWFVTRTVSRISGGRWLVLWPGIRMLQPYFQRAYARSAVRLVSETDAPLGGLRRLRRRMVGGGPSGVEGIAKLGYGMGPEPGPFDKPPAEPIELDADAVPWELREE
jgi:uncharacterized protein (UPF0548 family)